MILPTLQNRTTDPQNKTSSSQNVQSAVIWSGDSQQNDKNTLKYDIWWQQF